MATATSIKGTFLPIEQLAGKAFDATDFAILSGVVLSYNRKAIVWSASSNGWWGKIRVVCDSGSDYSITPSIREAGAVPALLSSSDSSPIKPSEARLSGKIFDYPQTAASNDVSKNLEKAYLDDDPDLKATNRIYTYDSERYNAYDKPCKYEKLQEYEYQGKTYVRIKGQPWDSYSVLANGHKVEEGKMNWIEVEPVKDEPIVLYRCKFDDNSHYNGDFSQTFANKFLNETVLPEMQQVRDVSKYPTRESDTVRTAAIAAHKGEVILPKPQPNPDRADSAKEKAIADALAEVTTAQATLNAALEKLSALVSPSTSPTEQKDTQAVAPERTRAAG